MGFAAMWNGFCGMAVIHILLKKWSPLFDSKKEKMESEPIWARLLHFLIQYWNESRIAAIKNRLGKYIKVECLSSQRGR